MRTEKLRNQSVQKNAQPSRPRRRPCSGLLRDAGTCLTAALAVVFLNFWPAKLSADNILNFYGERAPGLAGAYGGVSDDPAGAIYNPAGLAFAYDDYISISASNYRDVELNYQDVFGPGQNYDLKYRKYAPNFIGALSEIGDWKLALSLVSPIDESFDQSNNVLFPLILLPAGVGRIAADFTEDNLRLQGGPSLARRFGERFSLGITLHYFEDTSRAVDNLLVQQFDGETTQTTTILRRRTNGYIPILGMQYMLLDTLSAGLSLQRTFVTDAYAQESQYTIGEQNGEAIFREVLGDSGGYSVTSTPAESSLGPPPVAELPEQWQGRLGFGWFPSRRLLAAFDVIYTSGYTLLRDRTIFNVAQDNVILQPRKTPELERNPTLDFALGFEYYITENWALRTGAYTNFASSPEPDWREFALTRALETVGLRNLPVYGNVLYRIPGPENGVSSFSTYGASLGFGYENAGSSFSLTVSQESGSGTALITADAPPQRVEYRSLSLFVVATTRR